MERERQRAGETSSASQAQSAQSTQPDASFRGLGAEGAATPADLLAAERRSARAARFQAVDALVGRLLTQLLTGERVIDAVGGERSGSDRRVRFRDLPPAERHLVDDTWSVARLRERGAWFLPDRATLHVGQIQLPWLYLHRGPYAGALVDEQRYRVTLAETADAVLLWAVFEPLCQTLFLPFTLRGAQEGSRPREEVRSLWAEVDALLAALGLEVAAETAVMRYGGGWSKLHAAERRDVKMRLLQALSQQASPELATRLRGLRLHALVTQYYAKAKDGYATRKQALTKAHHPALVAYFGGDWLAFLDYLGERPHPDEEIVTALPAPRLYVGGSAKVAEVAAQLGLPARDVAQIAGSLWQSADARSPIEERSAALADFWRVFDALHARQAPGMPPLWGLVDDEGRGPIFQRALPPASSTPALPYQPRLYQTRFPADLLARIQRLWGRTLVPAYPERIVSEPYSHALLAETLGPALRFWNGCALTAWFLCEGPYSRTDMAGLATYHARELAALAELGAPVPAELFTELIREQDQLGPPQPIANALGAPSAASAVGGIGVTITTYAGARRDGFERLRDIITRYRRGWTETHWEWYVRARWEGELRAASHAFSEALARDGRPPSPKQLARAALAPITHWFGGDLSLLYAAIGEVAPFRPVVDLWLPEDPLEIVMRVRRALHAAFPQIADAARQARQRPELAPLIVTVDRLAEQSVRYAQLAGAVGRPPSLKEFGTTRLHDAAAALATTPEALWERFAACVEHALADPPPTSPR